MRVEFTVPGCPQGKGRPRFRKVGNFTQTYTPKETVMYENLVKMSYKHDIGLAKLNGAIYAKIVATFPIPNSVSRKQREIMKQGNVLYTKKIDADNLAKCILDALNNVAFDDDKQVAKLFVVKKYGENPQVRVMLEEVDQQEEA